MWEIAALGGPSRRIASTASGGDVSHDGRRVALFQSSDAGIDLMTIARDGSYPNVVARLPPRYIYRTPRWSPDDRFLAFHRDTDDTYTNYLEVVPSAGGEVREIARSEWLAGVHLRGMLQLPGRRCAARDPAARATDGGGRSRPHRVHVDYFDHLGWKGQACCVRDGARPQREHEGAAH